MSKRRSYTKEQKMQILLEGESEGMLATCRIHEIAQSLYYRWKYAFEQKGIDEATKNTVGYQPPGA
jgi:transposase-like protein